jgi:hypothetical protein
MSCCTIDIILRLVNDNNTLAWIIPCDDHSKIFFGEVQLLVLLKCDIWWAQMMVSLFAMSMLRFCKHVQNQTCQGLALYIYMIYYIYICICIYISHVFKYIDVILLNVPNLSNTTRNQKLLGYRSMLAKSAPQFNRWIRASNVVDYKIFSVKHRKSYWKWLEIVDLPMKMVIFHMLVNPNKFLKSNTIPPPPSE